MMNVQPSLVIGFGKMGRAVLDELAGQIRQSYGEDNLARIVFLNFDLVTRTGDLAVEGHTLFADPSDWIFEANTRPSLKYWFDKNYYRQNLARFSLEALDRQLVRLCLFRFITQQPEYLIDLFKDRVNRVLYQYRLLRDTTQLEHQTITLPVYLIGNLTNPIMSGLYLDIAYLLRLVTKHTAESRIILSGGIATQEESGFVELFTIFRELQRFGSSDSLYPQTRGFVYETSDPRYHETGVSPQLIQETWLDLSEGLGEGDWAAMWADSLLPLLDFQFGEYFKQALTNTYAQKIEKSAFFVSNLKAQAAIFPRQMILDYWSQQAAKATFRLWIGSSASSHDYRLERWTKGELVRDPFSGLEFQTPSFVAEIWQMNRAANTPVEVARYYQDSTRRFTLLKGVLGNELIPNEFRPGNLLSHAEDYAPNQIDSFHRFVVSLIKNTFSSLDRPQDFQKGQYWQAHHNRLEHQLTAFRGHLYGWVLRLLQDENLGIATVHYLLHQFHRMLKQAEQALVIMLERQQKDHIIPRLPNRLEGLLPFINKLPSPTAKGLGRYRATNRMDEGLQNYLNEADQIANFFSQWVALSLFYKIVQECQTITQSLLEHLDAWENVLIKLPTGLDKQLSPIPTFDMDEHPTRYKTFDAKWVQREYEKRASSVQINKWVQEIRWVLQPSDQAFCFYPYLGENNHLDWRQSPEVLSENLWLWQTYFHNLIYNQNSRLNFWSYLTDTTAQNNNIQQIKAFFEQPIIPLSYLDSGDIGRVATTLTWLIMPQPSTPSEAELTYRKRVQEALIPPAFTEAEISETHQTRLTKLVFRDYIPLHNTEIYQQSERVYYSGIVDEQQRHRTGIFAEEVQSIQREYDVERTFRTKNFKLSIHLSLAMADPDRINLFMWGQLLRLISVSSNITQDFLAFCLQSSDNHRLFQNIDQRLHRDVEKWMHDWQDHHRAFPDPEIGQMVEQLQATPCAELAARLGYERLLLAEYEPYTPDLSSIDPIQGDLYRLLIVVARNGLLQRRTQIRDMLNSC